MRKTHRIFLVLTIAWMAVIFIFSSQSANISGNTSGFFTSIVIDIFVPDYDAYDAAKQQEIFENTSLIIRKCAHFAEYFILACLSYVMFLSKLWIRCIDGYITIPNKQARSDIFSSCRLKSAVLSILLSVLYAITDEFHQGFVDGRVPAIWDVFIDGAGAILGTLMITLIISRFYYEKYRVRRRKLPG